MKTILMRPEMKIRNKMLETGEKIILVVKQQGTQPCSRGVREGKFKSNELGILCKKHPSNKVFTLLCGLF